MTIQSKPYNGKVATWDFLLSRREAPTPARPFTASLASGEWIAAARRWPLSRNLRPTPLWVDRIPGVGGEKHYGCPILFDGAYLILMNRHQPSEREKLLTLAHECYHLRRGECRIWNDRAGRFEAAPWLKGWTIDEDAPERWAEEMVQRAELGVDRGLLNLGLANAYWLNVLRQLGAQ